MAGSLDLIGEAWPSDDGWPYPDADVDIDLTDLEADLDEDLVSLHAMAPHLLDRLSPLERDVIVGRFGLDGAAPRTMKELQHDLHAPRSLLRMALGDGLAKLRIQLTVG